MIRLVLFFLGVLAAAAGLSWLADQPGTLRITFQDYVIDTTVFRAVVILCVLAAVTYVIWAIAYQIWSSPAAVSHYLTRRRQRRGLDALSSGMIALGAGDSTLASRYASQARKSLPNEPLTQLLRAQTAQLSGDKATARRIYEAMLASTDTEQLGLRGLYLEAQREGEVEAQQQFAERALALNPQLSWPMDGLFALQCKEGDWQGALETLARARRIGQVEKPLADRRRAVLLTAQAQAMEESAPQDALTLALEAHRLAPKLIPAAAIAGRLLIARGNTQRASKIIQKTWSSAPHPELATAFAFARVGDSPRDRLDRVKQLSRLAPHAIETWIAVAIAAVDAKDFGEARRALAPYINERLTRRVAALLARIEAEEHGDRGKAREWLARAATAQSDAAWVADGVISERWAPTSPVTGELDAFDWKVPREDASDGKSIPADLATGGALSAEALDNLLAPDVTVSPDQSSSQETTSMDDAIVATSEPAKSMTQSTTPTKPAPPPSPTPKPSEPTQAEAKRPPKAKVSEEITMPLRAPDDPGPDGDFTFSPDPKSV